MLLKPLLALGQNEQDWQMGIQNMALRLMPCCVGSISLSGLGHLLGSSAV